MLLTNIVSNVCACSGVEEGERRGGERLRLFEMRVIELFREGVIRGSTHTYIGMEAGAVGACTALRADDYITSTHRGHGHCIAKGGDVRLMMAELLGKAGGNGIRHLA